MRPTSRRSSGSRFSRPRATDWLAALAMLAFGAAPATASVIAPDNGAGTVALPPAGMYVGSLYIQDGLPLGTRIDIAARIITAGGSEAAGGFLGGDVQTWNPPALALDLVGVGTLAGFARSLSVWTAFVETHSAPRAPGTSPQVFGTDLVYLQGQLPPNDPDFDLLRITAGTGFGLPSPGQTTLVDLGGGSWSVDSFFDITFRIDFIGAPGSSLSGPGGTYSGSTTGTERFDLVALPEPTTGALLATGLLVLARQSRAGERRRSQ